MSPRNDRLQARLKDKDFKLTALLEITQAINANDDTSTLLEHYREVLCGALNIGQLALFTDDGGWNCVLTFGFEGEVQPVADSSFFKQEVVTLEPVGAPAVAFDRVVEVFQDQKPLAYLLLGDVRDDEIGMSPVVKHHNFIETITNVIIVAVRNRQLQEESIRQERMRKELELAAEMQAMLVPTSLPSNDHYTFGAIYLPHQQVGGDYYDVFAPNDHEVAFCVADVSGKGVSAAFLMANFQANLRSIFRYREMPLPELVRELNERVLKSAMGEKYITFFIAVYDTRTRRLRYINCGHNPPLLLHPDLRIEELKLGSIGLGMFDEIPRVDQGEVTVASGSMLLCYTDGLTEVENASHEEFGPDRVVESMRESSGKPVGVVLEDILFALDSFRGDSPFVDDTALLGGRFL